MIITRNDYGACDWFTPSWYTQHQPALIFCTPHSHTPYPSSHHIPPASLQPHLSHLYPSDHHHHLSLCSFLPYVVLSSIQASPLTSHKTSILLPCPSHPLLPFVSEQFSSLLVPLYPFQQVCCYFNVTCIPLHLFSHHFFLL